MTKYRATVEVFSSVSVEIEAEDETEAYGVGNYALSNLTKEEFDAQIIEHQVIGEVLIEEIK